MYRGRGRGRCGGPGLSFNTELLGLGHGGDSLPSTVLTPPPKYPTLLVKPSPLLLGLEQEYLLAVKKDFLNQMRNSCFYLKADDGDGSGNGQKEPLRVSWNLLPAELRPSARKRTKKKNPKKGVGPKLIKRNVKEDPSSKLEELEAKEVEIGDDDEKVDDEDGEKPGNKDNSDDDEENENKEGNEDSEVDDADEELDEGTDYANNYFDNGEDYIDEDDDNLDEGGIY